MNPLRKLLIGVKRKKKKATRHLNTILLNTIHPFDSFTIVTA
jgi:hypothetical protein